MSAAKKIPSSTEAIARSFDDRGVLTPRGTLVVMPVEGSDESFAVTLYDRGRTIELPIIHQAKTRNRHYALLAKAFARVAETV